MPSNGFAGVGSWGGGGLARACRFRGRRAGLRRPRRGGACEHARHGERFFAGCRPWDADPVACPLCGRFSSRRAGGGRGDGAVDDQRQLVLLADRGDLLEGGDVEPRVARGVAVDGAGFVVDQGLEGGGVFGVGEAHLDAELRQGVSEEGCRIVRQGVADFRPRVYSASQVIPRLSKSVAASSRNSSDGSVSRSRRLYSRTALLCWPAST